MLRLHGPDRRPLTIPAFRRLWLASVVSAVGGSFSLIALPAQLFALTGSSATIGWSATVSLPALMIAALWAGARADIADRRHLLLTAYTGLTLGHLLLWLQTIMDLRSVPVLLALVAWQSLSYGAIVTTSGAVLPRVVPPDLLAAANSLNSLAMYTGAVVGPLLAGLLIPVTGLGTLYLLDAIALIIVLSAVLRLPALPARTGPATIGRDVRRPLAGFRLLATDRVLTAVVGLDLAATVFGMPWALFPELAAQIGGPGDSTVLTLLYAAFPAGILACTLTSGTFTRTLRPGRLMAVATLVWGATVVLAGLAPALWLTLAALGLGGAANLLLSTCRKTIAQTRVDDSQRGRLQGALTVVSVGGPQAGNLVHGFAGAVWGARPAICLGGVLTAVTAATIIARSPGLWRLHADLDGPASSPSAVHRIVRGSRQSVKQTAIAPRQSRRAIEGQVRSDPVDRRLSE